MCIRDRELGIHYEPHPELTACGSVRLDYMFAKAQQIARYTALCYAAVSYTHLDVYKRQPLDSLEVLAFAAT